MLNENSSQAGEDSPKNIQMETALASHIGMVWNANRIAKQTIEQQMLTNIRRRDGIYEPEELSQIQKQGGSDIFIQVTGIKCHALKAWLKDIMIPAGERPFSIDPTPIVELPPEYHELAKTQIVNQLQKRMAETGVTAEQISQDRDEMVKVAEQVKKDLQTALKEKAESDAQTLTREVDDELTEGSWYQALDECVDDIVDLPAGFIHGPIVRKKDVLEWTPDESGKSRPAVVSKIVREYERVSPFDIYPSAGAKNLQQGSLIHRCRFYPDELSQMIGVPGWDEHTIRQVLILYGVGGLRDWLSIDQSRADVEGRSMERQDPTAKIDALKFMGKIIGRTLLEWGMSEEEVPDAEMSYNVVAYLIGSFVVSAKINSHPLGRRNYFSACFRRKNDSIWGKGVPDVMEDNQRICNGCARALTNNMAIAAGPQVWQIADRLPPDEIATDIYPLKLWNFTSSQMTGKNDLPVGFFQPTLIADKLISIFKFFYDISSEVTGIPAYVYGSEKVTGAGSTATGLSMLLNAAGKGIKSVAGHIDIGIIKPSVEEHWLHIMMTDPERAMGDVKIVPRASDYLIQMEQLQMQIAEVLNSTQNPFDMKIMGLEGRAEILREQLKHTKLPVDKIIPDRESIMQISAQDKVNEFVESLSQKMGVPAEQLLSMAQGGM